MTDAWFSPETARFFSYLSLLSLCSLFAIPASKGGSRPAVGVWNAVVVFAGCWSARVLSPHRRAAAARERALLLSGVVVGVTFVSRGAR